MLDYKLIAKNSSGEQLLSVYYDTEVNEVNVRLYGDYNKKYFQIDFDELNEEEFDEFYQYVKLVRNQMLQKRSDKLTYKQ